MARVLDVSARVPCDVCLAGPYQQLLPERAPRELGDDTECTYQRLCPRCVDALLHLFPLRPDRFAQRELTGRFAARGVRHPRKKSSAYSQPRHGA
jgi:hypothetical protein